LGMKRLPTIHLLLCVSQQFCVSSRGSSCLRVPHPARRVRLARAGGLLCA